MPPAAALASVALKALPFVASAGISAFGTNKAAKTQAQAAEQAGQQQLALGREQLEATQPLRDLALEQAQFQFGQQQQIQPQFAQAALETLPLLRQDVNRAPGESALFKKALETGTRGIVSNLAPFGLADSSVTGRAVGEFGAGLQAQDMENIRARRFQLAGFAPQAPSFFGGGTAGLNTSAQLQQGGILSQLQGGQTQAAGQLGIGKTLAQLPLLMAFQGGGSPTGSSLNLFGG